MVNVANFQQVISILVCARLTSQTVDQLQNNAKYQNLDSLEGKFRYGSWQHRRRVNVRVFTKSGQDLGSVYGRLKSVFLQH